MRLLLFLALFSNQLSAQNDDNLLIYKDTNQEIYLMKEITKENMLFLKVCMDLYNCKGFISDEDTLGIESVQMDIRAIVSPLSDYKFEIKYKFRNSLQFIVDTFNIYSMDTKFSIALPFESERPEFNPEDIGYWNFFPASTDERDVVFVKQEEDKVIFYLKTD